MYGYTLHRGRVARAACAAVEAEYVVCGCAVGQGVPKAVAAIVAATGSRHFVYPPDVWAGFRVGNVEEPQLHV